MTPAEPASDCPALPAFPDGPPPQLTCEACADPRGLGFDFTFAFQPIVDLESGTIWSHEALVRGPEGQGAGAILARVDDGNRYRFDQACRVKAVALAAELGLGCHLNINFLPNAVYRPELCIRTTLQAAERHGFPLDRLVFEVTEGEQIQDGAHLARIITEYKRMGFKTAIDDFGAGYAGLNLLADYQPDLIKLDLALVRDIDSNRARQAIVKGILQVCRDMGIGVIAEGIETAAERDWLAEAGIRLMQGYFFARPAFRSLATWAPA